tara:strand:+ start:351 stop:557 length:207 start_codon:yes stop_codon:yes gene_type:complete
MSIKVYRVKIEGYVVHEDSSQPTVTPVNWDRDQLLALMAGNCTVTETLVDTIEDNLIQESWNKLKSGE